MAIKRKDAIITVWFCRGRKVSFPCETTVIRERGTGVVKPPEVERMARNYCEQNTFAFVACEAKFEWPKLTENIYR